MNSQQIQGRVLMILMSTSLWVHLWNQEILSLQTTVFMQVLCIITLASSMMVVLTLASMPVVLFAACSHLVFGALTFPLVPEHELILLCTEVLMLGTCVTLRTTDPGVVYDKIAPSIRTLVWLCYAAAALAKYNTAFLDPEVSCAIFLIDLQTQFVPDPLAMLSLGREGYIYIAIGSETLIPLLLLFPRTRAVGVLLGLAFHFAVSYSPAVAVFDFTSALYMWWWLFLPSDAVDQVASLMAPLRKRYSELDPLIPYLWRGIMVFPMVATFAGPVLPPPLFKAVRAFSFVCYAVVLSAFFVIALMRSKERLDMSMKPSRFALPIFMLMGLNLAAPYLGFKSEASYTMFSNIRTEGGASNHLILPSTAWVDHLTLVEIESSSNEFLQSLADDGLLIPIFELHRIAQTTGRNDSASWILDGQRHEDPILSQSPRLSGALGFQHRIFHSRVVSKGRQECRN